jgi:hypothetical protein
LANISFSASTLLDADLLDADVPGLLDVDVPVLLDADALVLLGAATLTLLGADALVLLGAAEAFFAKIEEIPAGVRLDDVGCPLETRVVIGSVVSTARIFCAAALGAKMDTTT